MALTMAPAITLRSANAFIRAHHRHHKPARGCRFVLAATADGRVVGVLIAGRPVARGVNPAQVLEVTRCCTDGTPNACSFLYGAAARIARAMGYRRIQTYLLAEESGASLRASGWQRDGDVSGRPWDHSSERQLFLDGTTRRQDQPTSAKARWARELAA
jgi:hypothetical protein